MKTPVWSLLIVSIFLFKWAFAQTSEDYSLAVNKNNQLIVSTHGGGIAFSDSINGHWRKISGSEIIGRSTRENEGINICYFNEDTAIVSGCNYDKGQRNNFIYHTINGGKSWTPVDIGTTSEVTDVAYLGNGTAWLNLRGKGIAYTKDYGFTWTRLTVPKMKNWYQWIHQIYFNTRQEGITGSPWNSIALTRNNCKTWTRIPTPLDQKKYYKSDIRHAPEINQVGIFNGYMLVSQQHLVFYSKIDKVNWIRLPGYTGFYTDPENSALFLKKYGGGFVRCNSDLQPVASFESIGPLYAATCRNGNLFILSDNKIGQINSSDKLIVSNGEGVAPKETSHRAEAKAEKAIEKEMLNEFCSKPIQTIIFSKGGAGGFEQSSDTMAYELKENRFILSRKAIVSGNPVDLKENANEIDKQAVVEFVKQLPALYQKRATINELGFTQQDYDTCKQNMLSFKTTLDRQIRKKEMEEEKGAFTFYVNDLNFSRLLALVDSVKTIQQSFLDSYFDWYDFGTGNLWARVIFVNTNNDMLEIENVSFGKPSPFYFPWVIKLNGTRSISSAMEINRFLQRVFLNFLDYPTNKVAAIQDIVKLLYWQQQ